MRASAVYIVKTNHLNVNQGGANCLPIILTPAHYDKVGGKVTREIENSENVGEKIASKSRIIVLFPKELAKHYFVLSWNSEQCLKYYSLSVLKFSVSVSFKATTQWSKTGFRKTNH